MPDYVVTGPDGRQLRFTGPEAPSQAMIEQGFQKLPDPQQAWQKAQGIGPARVGERYLPTGGPMGILDVIRTVLGGAQRPASVAAQDPYGIQAWEKGAGPMPTPIAAETQAVGPGITAYHGSPYDFEKFDLGKIGTGEGAQAYGHGLYFAQNPEVAEEYRRTLAGADPRRIERIVAGGTPNLDTAHTSAAESFKQSGVSESEALTGMQQAYPQAHPRDLADAVHYAYHVPSKGKTYQVSIAAHPDQFLDWDKPISQQPEVMKALEQSDMVPYGKQSIGWRGAPAGMWEKAMAQTTGEKLYRELGSSHQEVSQALRDAGLGGIKYLDQGSRGWTLVNQKGRLLRGYGSEAEAQAALANLPPSDAPRRVTKMPYDQEWAIEGQSGTSRNFVVFDDSLISIMKKYGIALPFFAGMSRLAQRQQQGQQ